MPTDSYVSPSEGVIFKMFPEEIDADSEKKLCAVVVRVAKDMREQRNLMRENPTLEPKPFLFGDAADEDMARSICRTILRFNPATMSKKLPKLDEMKQKFPHLYVMAELESKFQLVTDDELKSKIYFFLKLCERLTRSPFHNLALHIASGSVNPEGFDKDAATHPHWEEYDKSLLAKDDAEIVAYITTYVKSCSREEKQEDGSYLTKTSPVLYREDVFFQLLRITFGGVNSEGMCNLSTDAFRVLFLSPEEFVKRFMDPYTS